VRDLNSALLVKRVHRIELLSQAARRHDDFHDVRKVAGNDLRAWPTFCSVPWLVSFNRPFLGIARARPISAIYENPLYLGFHCLLKISGSVPLFLRSRANTGPRIDFLLTSGILPSVSL
jgi:hypothetical protein